MERPKGKIVATPREVTAEIVYLDEMRRNAQPREEWPADFSDETVQRYEAEARMLNEQGVRPKIMDEYDLYDTKNQTEIGVSCALLAEELLALKEPNSRMTFEDFVVDMPVDQVMNALQGMRAGEVLAAGDKQLAFESNGEYYPILDIKKEAAVLQGVSLRVWGWSDGKWESTKAPDETYDYARDCLHYPKDEKSRWYELQLAFSYTHPDPKVGHFNESITLSVGQRGDLRLSSQVWVSAYAETGYEGHSGKRLKHATDADYAAFADLIAKMAGDEPEAIWHLYERKVRTYIDTIPSEESREYLLEWIDNTFASHILYRLSDLNVNGQSLNKALKNSEHANSAHAVLVEEVNKERRRRNDLAADVERSKSWIGSVTEPWRDRVQRED